MYTAIYKVSKYMKKSTGLKGKKDNFTIIVNNINTPLSTIYRLTDRYLIETDDLNIASHLDLIDICFKKNSSQQLQRKYPF